MNGSVVGRTQGGTQGRPGRAEGLPLAVGIAAAGRQGGR
jgi:hypothetical protein